MNQTATIRIENQKNHKQQQLDKVSDRCLLSPLLFSIYAELMMKEALEETDEAVTIGGTIIKTFDSPMTKQ